VGLVGGVGIPGSCGTSSRLGSGAGWWQGSRWSWVQWHGERVGIPAWCGSRGWKLAQLRDGYPAVCGSGTELWPDAARRAESPAEGSSGSADLWGRDLAGRLFFY
jgi:hypothetical protein